MLPLDCVARTTTRTTRETLAKALRSVADAGADGVMVDCWWGACEGERPRAYEWRGYLALCEMCRDAGLSVDVVLSFHACRGLGRGRGVRNRLAGVGAGGAGEGKHVRRSTRKRH